MIEFKPRTGMRMHDLNPLDVFTHSHGRVCIKTYDGYVDEDGFYSRLYDDVEVFVVGKLIISKGTQ